MWMGGSGPMTRQRAGASFDGWMPLATDALTYAEGVREVRVAARRARRPETDVTAAAYLTINIGSPTALNTSVCDWPHRISTRS
jgi:alkanesulfonate monooxygenase SsuD/methylene tetrahydromethanopterin reductase-like flavin-dependent oxidoreductase (luciferase family)